MITGFPSLSSTVDNVFLFIAGISVALLVAITVAMVYFVIRYRRDRHPEAEQIEGNLLLETVWTVIPTLIVLAMFYYGYVGFKYMRKPPENSMPVKALARKWSWLFQYENGKRSDVLYVPVRTPVKLSITSADVLHSLYIPAYRVKEDAVPGMETSLWFYPDEEGEHEIFCAEYCGMGHSRMMTKVVVVPGEKFREWLGGAGTVAGGGAPEGRKGEALFTEKGCGGCHSIDGSQRVGPSLKGVYGKKRTVLAGDREMEVVADEDYLRRSLLEPQADVVKGFPPIMPPQGGSMKGEEIDQIVAYLKELK